MDTNHTRILIVDDSPQVRQNLATVLDLAASSAGLRMDIIGQAGHGRAAVELSQTLRPDVILMDLEMPFMDGYEATRRIKAQPCAPRVVILSVHAGAREEELARTAGADGFVVKGASYQTLLNAILGIDETSIKKGEK